MEWTQNGWRASVEKGEARLSELTTDNEDWFRNRKSRDGSRELITMPTLAPAPLLLKLLPPLSDARIRSSLPCGAPRKTGSDDVTRSVNNERSRCSCGDPLKFVATSFYIPSFHILSFISVYRDFISN